jgi:hypothetical protein
VLRLELELDDRSTAGAHINAVTRFRDTGSAGQLAAFRGVSVGGHELETDPDEIEYLAGRGKLDFEDFYDE